MPGPLLATLGPPAISAGLSFAGGLLGNRARRKEAARDRAFQERMRNTQWQAGVEDMRAAGINPALAYSQGPAASPSGSMAQQDDVVSGAVSSAMQAKRLQADLDLIKAQTEKVRHEGKAAEAAAGLSIGRLAAYGTTYENGRLRFDKLAEDGLPWMTREIMAGISNVQARTQRELYTGATLKPMADFADRIGEFLPMLMLLTQMNPGGIMKGLSGFKRNPVKARVRR